MHHADPGRVMLCVEHASVQNQQITLLQDIDFFVPDASCLTITGNTGSGKSLLLKYLSGRGAALSAGHMHWLGQPITADHAPPLVRWSCGMLMSKTFEALLERVRVHEHRSREEWATWLKDRLVHWGFPELPGLWHLPVLHLSALHQRVVAIAREALCQPQLLLIDDLTKGLDEYDRFVLLDFVRTIVREMAIVIVIAHAKEAKLLGGQHIVLHEGRMIHTGTEDSGWSEPSADSVFLPDDLPVTEIDYSAHRQPQNTSTNDDAWALMLDEMDPRAGEPSLSRPAELNDGFVPAHYGPRGFYWVIEGVLAGTPLPGLIHHTHHDLAALKRCNVNALLSLSQSEVDAEALAAHGIQSHWLSTEPSLAQLRMLAIHMERTLARGQVMAVHCVSGNRRTGLVLCAYLIHAGQRLEAAVQQVRQANPAFEPPEQYMGLLRELAQTTTMT